MKNVFIIDRKRYDQYTKIDWLPAHHIGGLPGAVVMFLDYFVIEEEDGSATFLKNRHNGLRAMTKEEYYHFKRDYMN
jgi:hypothetical protein